jgi:SnoaL-like domain
MSTPTAISDLVHRYSDAVARKDRDQWAATWAAESHWDLGQGRMMRGKEAIVEYWVEAMERFEVVIQLSHNGEATVDDAAGAGSGRWYISEHMQRVDGSTGVFLAYYDDTYARVDGEWLFASRAITVLYRGAADLSGTFKRPT